MNSRIRPIDIVSLILVRGKKKTKIVPVWYMPRVYWSSAMTASVSCSMTEQACALGTWRSSELVQFREIWSLQVTRRGLSDGSRLNISATCRDLYGRANPRQHLQEYSSITVLSTHH